MQKLNYYFIHPGPMDFEIYISRNTPLTSLDGLEEACEIFLAEIGYLPKGYGPRTGVSEVKESVPFRLFVDCFLRRRDKTWLVEELAHELKTSKPTIYRHINKLKGMDLLEESHQETKDGAMKKGYRLRYGNLSDAWHFTEEHVNVAMANYRKSLDHIQKLADKERK
jgi:predicted transcriptional regulator